MCPRDGERRTLGGITQNFSQKDEHEELEPTTVAGGEEHSEEWLKFFSQEAEQEITVECEPTTEERATYSMDFLICVKNWRP
jgi:hypothetical protein